MPDSEKLENSVPKIVGQQYYYPILNLLIFWSNKNKSE